MTIDSNPALVSSRIPATLWGTFVVCLLSNIFAGIVSTLLSVYLPVVVKDLTGSIDDQSLSQVGGIISSLYILGWAIGGLTWGFITDKIGRSKSLVIAVASYSVFTMLIGLSSSWELVVACRLLSGFAVGGLMVITPTLLSEIWPISSRSIILGIDSIGFPIGIFASGLVTYFVSDWRQAFLFALVPLVLSLAAIRFVRESDGWKSTAQSSGSLRKIKPEDRSNIIRGAVIFGSMLIGLWALFSWIPTWVQSILPPTEGQAERSITMMLLGGGGLFGGFISGWVSNILGVRRAMMVCFAGCFIVSVIMFGTNSVFSALVYAETILLALFFGMSQGLLSIYIPQMFPFSIRASATGFCFNAVRFITAAAVLFVGTLVNLLGGFGHALLAFSLVFLAGFLALYFSTENSTLKSPADGAY